MNDLHRETGARRPEPPAARDEGRAQVEARNDSVLVVKRWVLPAAAAVSAVSTSLLMMVLFVVEPDLWYLPLREPPCRLTKAALAGDVREIKAALDAGADPNAPCPDGCAGPPNSSAWCPPGRPVIFASVSSGVPDAVRVLLAAGARVPPVDPVPSAAFPPLLTEAVIGRHPAIVRMLVEAGAPIAEVATPAKRTALQLAEAGERCGDARMHKIARYLRALRASVGRGTK